MTSRPGSLRAKMALLLVAASAVPAALASAIEFRAARALIREQATALLSARTEAVAGQIDMFHREYQKIAARLAGLPAVRDFAAAPPGQRPVSEMIGGLRGYTDHDPNFRGLGIFDAAGTVIAATEAPLMGRNYAFRRYFADARSGAATTSEIYLAVPEVESAPSIAYAAPVKSAAGEVVGVVALWVRAEPFWRLVGRSNDKAGKGSYSLLVDRYGVRIAHSASADLLFRPTGPLAAAAAADLDAERRFGNRTRVLLQAPAPFPEVYARSQSPALETDVFRARVPGTGEWSLAVARRLETVPWTLVYLVPERSLDAPVVALVQRAAAGAVAVTLAALAVGFVFAGRIARSLSASEARLRALADTANDAIVSADREGLITYANPSVERLFGHPPADLAGKPVTVLMPERFRARHDAGLRRYLETREPRIIGRTVELVGLAKDGREFPIDLSLATWTDGGATAFTGVIRDISERRRAEEDLRRGRRELEAAAAQLAAANRELESFSYSVSHDLRAPLRHVAGFVDLLRRHAAASLDDTGRRYLETISSAALRMGRLIDDLLSFSRTGRGELTRTRVDLGPLVRDVARLAVQEEAPRTVALAVGELPAVVGDPSMLRIAFTNLLQNAVKYTRRREDAAVEVGMLPAADGQVTVFVRDNGAGFDMQYAGKLFGVFQRLHPVQEFEGTGIGLATVRRIVERHGGRAWAEGRVGEGATFYLTLPAAGDAVDRAVPRG